MGYINTTEEWIEAANQYKNSVEMHTNSERGDFIPIWLNAHQAIEYALKAVILAHEGGEGEYGHDLENFHSRLQDLDVHTYTLEEYKENDVLYMLSRFYEEGRYPNDSKHDEYIQTNPASFGIPEAVDDIVEWAEAAHEDALANQI